MAQSALTAPPPKETPSLDLHHQERSNQADAFGLDDMHTVYNHTHSSGRKVADGRDFCPGVSVDDLLVRGQVQLLH